jgi:peptide/nickel transport system permease protein
MLNYMMNRILLMIPFLILISIVSFIVIQLPPGNYVDSYVLTLQAQGGTVNDQQKAAIEAMYGLDKPMPVQYGLWITNILFHGNFGNSFLYRRPVADILIERIPKTVAISVVAILFTWIFALPLGVLSAVKQYSVEDHLLTFISLLGLAVPGFLLALVLMYAVYAKTGWLVNGLFSPAFRAAPWSFARFVDLLKNVWLPLFVLSVTGMAGIIRILRASLLDELKKQYVTTARAKGLSEWQLILRYPLRVAINPLLSTIGWMLPAVVGGEIVVSKVLNLPTTGPVLLEASLAQDMYLVGAIVMILSMLTVIGTFISDILLAINDPRIRYR